MRPRIPTAPLRSDILRTAASNCFRQARVSVPEIIHSKKTAVILHALEVEMRAALSGVSIKTEKIVQKAARDWIKYQQRGKA